MTPKKIHILTRDLAILDADTPLTRAWVSLNPHEARTEYINLRQIWHEADEEPEAGKQVAAIKDNDISCGIYFPYSNKGYNPRYQGLYWSGGGCLSGSIWVSWKGVVKWAYVDDLIPKGGRQ